MWIKKENEEIMNKLMNRRAECDSCGEEVDVMIHTEHVQFSVRDLVVESDFSIPRCPHCNSVVALADIEDENIRILYDVYKAKKGLLTSEEVRSIRTKYGLSQSDFALLLGLGEKTVTRYENGSIQDHSHDNLMRLVTEPTILKQLYAKNFKEISPSSRLRLFNRMVVLGVILDVDDEIRSKIGLLSQAATLPILYRQPHAVIMNNNNSKSSNGDASCNLTAA